ncbi:hypothetical protein [Nocardia niwae]|uniref:hypothetical protein n=1 Tax=Nocardia niwae TaxID=626084 RepID=UPI0007A44814|nr:hypothetical protein [Nocardia niwae]
MNQFLLTWFVRGCFGVLLAAALQSAYEVGKVDGWQFIIGSCAVASMLLNAYMVARLAWKNMVLI